MAILRTEKTSSEKKIFHSLFVMKRVVTWRFKPNWCVCRLRLTLQASADPLWRGSLPAEKARKLHKDGARECHDLLWHNTIQTYFICTLKSWRACKVLSNPCTLQWKSWDHVAVDAYSLWSACQYVMTSFFCLLFFLSQWLNNCFLLLCLGSMGVNLKNTFSR